MPIPINPKIHELLPFEKQRATVLRRFIRYSKVRFNAFEEVTLSDLPILTKRELYEIIKSFFYNEDTTINQEHFKFLDESPFALLI